MKTRSLVLVLVIALVSCGGSKTPTTPAPIIPPPLPKADLVGEGRGQWVNCLSFGDCGFQGEGRNRGAGCARSAKGVTRFYGNNDVQLGSAFSWSLVEDRILRPNEAFVYRTAAFVPATTVANTATFRAEMSWTDTVCP